MKRALMILPVVMSIICCSKLQSAMNRSDNHHGDDNTTSDSTETGQGEGTLAPLQLSLKTASLTKGLIEENYLPDDSSIGITVRDEYGKYDGTDYTNIMYTSDSSSGVQAWLCDTPIMLAQETGTVFSYWPFSETETDGRSITVEATSDIQTDFMWGIPVNVNSSNRAASITMQHALSAVRVYCRKGTYSNTGQITAISFSGDCAATAGTLDLACGSLNELSGQGTAISPTITAMTLSEDYQKVTDIIIVPADGANGKIVVTLDGVDYSIEFSTLELVQGVMTEFYLTAEDGELSASDIVIGSWTYGNSEGSEINVTNKVKIAGDIADIAFNTEVSEDGTVTIKAVPSIGEKSFTEVEPVTFTGTATLVQSSDIDTGIRTITISDIESDVVVTFAGTIEYHVIVKVNTQAGEEESVFGENVSQLWEQRATVSRLDWNDNKILWDIVQTGKYSTQYKVYTFPVTGTQTLKYRFTTNVVTHNIFQSCRFHYARVSGKVKTIDYSAFLSCSIKELHLSEGIETINQMAFAGTPLPSITFPSSLTEYGDSMLSSGHFIYLTIPKGAQSFGKILGTCPRLQYIVSYAQTAPTLNEEGVFADIADGGVLVVPNGADYSTWMNSDNLGGKSWTISYMTE